MFSSEERSSDDGSRGSHDESRGSRSSFTFLSYLSGHPVDASLHVVVVLVVTAVVLNILNGLVGFFTCAFSFVSSIHAHLLSVFNFSLVDAHFYQVVSLVICSVAFIRDLLYDVFAVDLIGSRLSLFFLFLDGSDRSDLFCRSLSYSDSSDGSNSSDLKHSGSVLFLN